MRMIRFAVKHRLSSTITGIGLAGAVLFLNETLTMLQLIGTGMTIIAIALVNVEHLKTRKP
ncbi:MAG: hypothetical protein ACPH74_04100 [Candidatus Puniceispirillum sp.]